MPFCTALDDWLRSREPQRVLRQMEGKEMSIKTIDNLEKELQVVLKRYEDEYGITIAEACGVLSVLKADRAIRAVLPYCGDLLKELLEIPTSTTGKAPVGKIIQIESEGKEGDEKI